jgi:hypothetical protein
LQPVYQLFCYLSGQAFLNNAEDRQFHISRQSAELWDRKAHFYSGTLLQPFNVPSAARANRNDLREFDPRGNTLVNLPIRKAVKPAKLQI